MLLVVCLTADYPDEAQGHKIESFIKKSTAKYLALAQ